MDLLINISIDLLNGTSCVDLRIKRDMEFRFAIAKQMLIG
jgi:hypothetical protein